MKIYGIQLTVIQLTGRNIRSVIAVRGLKNPFRMSGVSKDNAWRMSYVKVRHHSATDASILLFLQCGGYGNDQNGAQGSMNSGPYLRDYIQNLAPAPTSSENRTCSL
jgi:hypothetical protein